MEVVLPVSADDDDDDDDGGGGGCGEDHGGNDGIDLIHL